MTHDSVLSLVGCQSATSHGRAMTTRRDGSPTEDDPDSCDICGSTKIVWRNCKLICQNCGTMLKSCADLRQARDSV
jgi:hypothetical protein